MNLFLEGKYLNLEGIVLFPEGKYFILEETINLFPEENYLILKGIILSPEGNNWSSKGLFWLLGLLRNYEGN